MGAKLVTISFVILVLAGIFFKSGTGHGSKFWISTPKKWFFSRSWSYRFKPEARQEWDGSTPPSKTDIRFTPVTPTSGQKFESSSLSKDEEQYILDYHNRLRSRVKPNAANMVEMRWDDRLAERAQNYANQCNYKHSPKSYRRNKDGFDHIGENIYISTRNDYKKALEFWGNEDEFYNFRKNYCQPGEQCGHYTQMAWHWTNAVGCGHAYCKYVKNWSRNDAYFTVCLYGPQGNWNNKRPYTPGAPCSECPDGTHCRNNLCT